MTGALLPFDADGAGGERRQALATGIASFGLLLVCFGALYASGALVPVSATERPLGGWMLFSGLVIFSFGAFSAAHAIRLRRGPRTPAARALRHSGAWSLTAAGALVLWLLFRLLFP